ncbi:MAG: cell division protein FtsL [Myxococcaceae bacterium]|nr:cell division protein FtsL [Myxococcaceae bacterium]
MSVLVESKRGVSFSVILLELLPAALLVMLFAGVGIVHVTSRVLVVKVGYELSRLDQENATLERDRDRLKLELATMKSPARLESLARAELGLDAPKPGAIVHLKK